MGDKMRPMRQMGQIRPMGDCIFWALPISPIGRIGLISPILNALWGGYRFQYLWLRGRQKGKGKGQGKRGKERWGRREKLKSN